MSRAGSFASVGALASPRTLVASPVASVKLVERVVVRFEQSVVPSFESSGVMWVRVDAPGSRSRMLMSRAPPSGLPRALSLNMSSITERSGISVYRDCASSHVNGSPPWSQGVSSGSLSTSVSSQWSTVQPPLLCITEPSQSRFRQPPPAVPVTSPVP